MAGKPRKGRPCRKPIAWRDDLARFADRRRNPDAGHLCFTQLKSSEEKLPFENAFQAALAAWKASNTLAVLQAAELWHHRLNLSSSLNLSARSYASTRRLTCMFD